MELPPIIPGTEEELNRAIILLGNRTITQLNQKSQDELINLVGEYPNNWTAQRWKNSLKQVVKKLANNSQSVKSSKLKKKPLLKKKTIPHLSEGNPADCNAETQIILDWVKEKLSDFYLDDEECYDPDLIAQIKAWYAASPERSKEIDLAKKFLEMSLAFEQEHNPLDFDLNNYNFDLEQEPLAPDASSFVEPLIRLAFQKVDWEIIAQYLLKTLGLGL